MTTDKYSWSQNTIIVMSWRYVYSKTFNALVNAPQAAPHSLLFEKRNESSNRQG